MTTQEMIEVLTAYQNGAEIECSKKGGNNYWYFASEPDWDFNTTNYRVKSKPIYSFDNKELLGAKVKDKENGNVYLITGMMKTYIFFNNSYYTYEEFNKYFELC